MSPQQFISSITYMNRYATMEGIELSHTESPDTRSVDYNGHSSGVHFFEILCCLTCLECHGALFSKPHHLELHSPCQLSFTVQ
jgi:hypothetical protein